MAGRQTDAQMINVYERMLVERAETLAEAVHGPGIEGADSFGDIGARIADLEALQRLFEDPTARYEAGAAAIAEKAISELPDMIAKSRAQGILRFNVLDYRDQTTDNVPLYMIRLAACQIVRQCQNSGISAFIYDFNLYCPGPEKPIEKLPAPYPTMGIRPHMTNNSGVAKLGNRIFFCVVVDLREGDAKSA